MASKNQRKARGGHPDINPHKNDLSHDPETLGRARGEGETEPEPQTRSQRREEAGSGSEAAAQGPSGSETAGGAKAQSTSGQGESDEKGSIVEKYGTGGGHPNYGAKR